MSLVRKVNCHWSGMSAVTGQEGLVPQLRKVNCHWSGMSAVTGPEDQLSLVSIYCSGRRSAGTGRQLLLKRRSAVSGQQLLLRKKVSWYWSVATAQRGRLSLVSSYCSERSGVTG